MADFAALTLNGKRFSKAWVLANYRNLDSGDLKENEMATLSFCGRWLSGEEAFSVKTSGSTGPPKVIQLSRGQMKLSAHMTA
ncbi:MAG: acyl-CoA synthetase, partial [Calditrichaeota bacterium]|nr:acyl-CoA synthetase [Calditrichota bacterium]